jgi:hypothetical protein
VSSIEHKAPPEYRIVEHRVRGCHCKYSKRIYKKMLLQSIECTLCNIGSEAVRIHDSVTEGSTPAKLRMHIMQHFVIVIHLA